MPEQFVPTRNVNIALADGNRVLQAGQPVSGDDIPAASLKSLLQSGWLIAADQYVRDVPQTKPPKAEAAPEPAPPKPTAGEVRSHQVRNVPIGQLAIDAATKRALAAAGLLTVGQIYEYGSDHDGLQGIAGISEARERGIQAAIERIENQS